MLGLKKWLLLVALCFPAFSFADIRPDFHEEGQTTNTLQALETDSVLPLDVSKEPAVLSLDSLALKPNSVELSVLTLDISKELNSLSLDSLALKPVLLGASGLILNKYAKLNDNLSNTQPKPYSSKIFNRKAAYHYLC